MSPGEALGSIRAMLAAAIPHRDEFLHIGAGKYLFYTLIYLSLAIMATQIILRARRWMEGRPVESRAAGWRYWLPTKEDLRRWFGNVGLYVMAQRKVRSSRPRSGAPMHLLIFYGFCALFLATTILAVNTYGPYYFHKGLFYEVYELSFDALGLLFIIGLAWALGRRISVERKKLGRAALAPDSESYAKQQIAKRRKPISSAWPDYATLALLLTIGVTGYWLEAARISNVPKVWDHVSAVGYAWAQLQGPISDQGYVAIWWFHAALVMVFFATLPQMRIRHIVMAILTTAGNRRKPMGELKPISMEEVEQTGQIGVTLAKDYSRWSLMSLDACMECGRCTEVCPAWNVGKALNPKQVVQDLRLAMSSGAGVAETVSEEALWACTTCNACVEACPVLIRQADMIVDARRGLVAEGKLSGSGAVMLRQIGSTGNAWGQPASNREDWMKDLDVPLCRDGAPFEYLFWVGCAGATDPGAIKTTRAVAELLKKAGVSYACLGREEACTGDPARRIGDEFLWQEKAVGNLATLSRYGVRKVVTACPHCFNTLKNEYDQMEGATPLEVWHHSQLFAQLIEAGKLKAAGGDGIAYHDPCYLARINNESDAPRAIFGEESHYNEATNPETWPASESLREPPHRARKTLCCGAGGGRMWMEEPPTQRPSNRRAEELVETGAETVAVACPFCRIMLGDALKQVSEKEISLIDLAEALRDANA